MIFHQGMEFLSVGWFSAIFTNCLINCDSKFCEICSSPNSFLRTHPPSPPPTPTDALHLWSTNLWNIYTAWSIWFVCFQQSPEVLYARCVSSAWQSGHMGRHGSRSEEQTREQVKCGNLYHFLSSFIVKFTSCRVRYWIEWNEENNEFSLRSAVLIFCAHTRITCSHRVKYVPGA